MRELWGLIRGQWMTALSLLLAMASYFLNGQWSLAVLKVGPGLFLILAAIAWKLNLDLRRGRGLDSIGGYIVHASRTEIEFSGYPDGSRALITKSLTLEARTKFVNRIAHTHIRTSGRIENVRFENKPAVPELYGCGWRIRAELDAPLPIRKRVQHKVQYELHDAFTNDEESYEICLSKACGEYELVIRCDATRVPVRGSIKVLDVAGFEDCSEYLDPDAGEREIKLRISNAKRGTHVVVVWQWPPVPSP